MGFSTSTFTVSILTYMLLTGVLIPRSFIQGAMKCLLLLLLQSLQFENTKR